MKKYNFIQPCFRILLVVFLAIGCVHDDKYENPDLSGYQCRNAAYYADPAQAFVKWTIHDLKLKTAGEVITENAYIEGYVSSTDESGNIYKTLYLQDAPENPTEGLTVSIDLVSSYTRFPQGSKIYIELKGLAVTTYGNVKQLGRIASSGTRIPEKEIPDHIFRDCNIRVNVIPKVLTIAQFAGHDELIGCLIQLDNAEFDERALCTNFAPDGETANKAIGQGWNMQTQSYEKKAIVRNSGYASFANRIIPAGRGKFIGILSKYNSAYQLYINKLSDLDMENTGQSNTDPHFPRLDGKTSDPCRFSADGLTAKSVAELKQLAGNLSQGGLIQVTGAYYLKVRVSANDQTGNFFKCLYAQDATGGIRININRTGLYTEERFKVGKELYIKLKDLYVRNVGNELQLGSNDASGAVLYRIKDEEVFRYFFDSHTLPEPVAPAERTISQLSMADVGRWVRIRDLQFISSDLGRTYANGPYPSNTTLEDCLGSRVILRTNGRAVFGLKEASTIEVAGGKGDIQAIVSIFNDTYQLWIPQLSDIVFTSPRCDGTFPAVLPVLYSDTFTAGGFPAGSDWTAVSVSGAQGWTTSNQGNGTDYYAVMSGFTGSGNANEDWLISRSVSLAGKTKAAVSFISDIRYSGNALQVYATEHYTGNPATTVWMQLYPVLDTNTGAFGDWVNSGNVSLNAFAGKNVRVAFRYTSTDSASAIWEIDHFKIKAQ